MKYAIEPDKMQKEDFLLFINACFAGTGQQEFYSGSFEQGMTLDFLHEYMVVNYRILYSRTLASGINDFNSVKIIFNLLASGKNTPHHFKVEEGLLIKAALFSLPPNRVYRLFDDLSRWRINNRRTRAIISGYIEAQENPEFHTVKYRRRIRHAARHVHLKLNDERGIFLFKNFRKEKIHFQTDLFMKYQRAWYSKEAVYELPYSIAEGFAAKHDIKREVFLSKIQGTMTSHEKNRMRNASETKKGYILKNDLSRFSLTKLCLYFLSLNFEERNEQGELFQKAFEKICAHIVTKQSLHLGKVALVLDRSYSSSGSYEKKRRPLAIALGISFLCECAADQSRSFWTVPLDDVTHLSSRGQTDLASPLLKAIEWQPDSIFIVSDGYENDPPGAVNRIIKTYVKSSFGKEIEFIHFNPVFDEVHYEPRSLGSEVICTGIRNAEELFSMLGFARFARGNYSLSTLEKFMKQRSDSFVGAFNKNQEGAHG